LSIPACSTQKSLRNAGPGRLPPESRAPDDTAPIGLVLVGHVGWATNENARGTGVSLGGSGYAAAYAASTLLGGPVGLGSRAGLGSRVDLAAQIGQDLNLHGLHGPGLDLAGLAILPGASARFHISRPGGETRVFESELGVAASPRFGTFPEPYFRAGHVHLGTMPPGQQLGWLKFLRDHGFQAPISVDTFEHFVSTQPPASREVCDLADLIFINEAEYRGLYRDQEIPKAPTILKHGPRGADYIADGLTRVASAIPAVQVVDDTGAGEILAGAYLALRAHGLAADQALGYAVRAASSSVTEFGVDGPHLTRALTAIRAELLAARPA
jgi:sugar/nucleoside kinase (ribokinase family)